MRDTRKDFVPPQSHARRAWKSKSSVPGKIVQGERRHVCSASPDGLISWHDVEQARLDRAINQRIIAEKIESQSWKPNKPKPK